MGQPAARLTDLHTCPAITGSVPHVGGPVLPPCKPDVLVAGLPAARLSDMALCVGPTDVIARGAATVLIGGLPAARLQDTTVHGGLIVGPCAPTVLIGDPAFGLPPGLTIGGTPAFQNKVIRDLFFLSTLASGRELLRRLGAAGQAVNIIPNPGTNGYCSPTNWAAAHAGTPTASVVQYNPDYRSNAYDASGNLIAQPPQVILGHELRHALANSEGTHRTGTDPSPPASEPSIQEEEAQAIGTGSHSGGSPSENSLRSDAGLPARDNHFGTGGPAAGEPAALNLRPGG